MTFTTPTNNGTDQSHEKRQDEQAEQEKRSLTASKGSKTKPGTGHPRHGAQHCILCQIETVGACLLCHRPLCEQCGRSEYDFLRCPGHHEHEVEALRTSLRQAAFAVLGTRRYVSDLVVLRNHVLHEINAALLRSYVEHAGGVPSPAQIQQMRRVAVALWNSLAMVEEGEELSMRDTTKTGSEPEQEDAQ